MYRFLSLALFLPFALLAADAKEDGFVDLFDGKTLGGWVQRGGKAKYAVVAGEIVGSSVPGTPNSFLCTKKEYGDFILELEFKVDPKLNSGVQIRSKVFDKKTKISMGKDKKSGEEKFKEVNANVVHGYQVEIDPSDRAWTGGIYDESRRGWLNDLKGNDAARKAFKQNEWNRFRVECKGDSIKTFVNGVAAADLKDGLTPSGVIALQVHGVGAKKDTMEVRWRKVRIKELK